MINPHDKIEQALLNIGRISGVGRGQIDLKGKSIVKFGSNPNIGTSLETVWRQGGNEVFPTGNTIDSVISTDAGDTQSIIVEGHTISGSTITFVSQTVILNGQTAVALGTPLYRMSRIKNNDSTDFAGTVYGYESSVSTPTAGVPSPDAGIHIKVDIGNQSQKASTTFSSEDWFIITEIDVSVGISGGSSRTVDAFLEIREQGGVFREVLPLSANNQAGSTPKEFDPCILVPAGADVRMVAISSGANTQVKAFIGGHIAKLK